MGVPNGPLSGSPFTFEPKLSIVQSDSNDFRVPLKDLELSLPNTAHPASSTADRAFVVEVAEPMIETLHGPAVADVRVTDDPGLQGPAPLQH